VIITGAWWTALSLYEQILYCIAAGSSIVLILQLIFMFAGGLAGDADLNISDTSGIGADIGEIGADIGEIGADIGEIGADIGEIGADIGEIGADIGEIDTEFDSVDYAGTDEFPDATDMPVSAERAFSTLRLFTFQGILAFLASFSWISILGLSGGLNALIATAIGVAIGVLMMFAVAKLIQLLMKLSDDGTVDFNNAVGIRAVVYIPIPGNLAGEGKVMAEFQGAERECDAITALPDTIPTGAEVVVTSIKGNTLIVERV
jgi:membrane protein implicated in regulation of membrane protease activity